MMDISFGLLLTLVHARGREAMEWLIRNGYAHCVLAGNAVAVHDIVLYMVLLWV